MASRLNGTVLRANRRREHEGAEPEEMTVSERATNEKRLKRKRKEKQMSGKYPPKPKWLP